jgi:GNAT superfamily N-acetyltransferase
LNVARLRHPLEHPATAGFVDALVPVNALADSAPGFVWRLQTDDGDATSIRPFPDADVLVNLSVWQTIADLKAFAYAGEHLRVFRQRREWFDDHDDASLALWWVPAGSVPTVAEAAQRLAFLRRHGPTPYAFTFSHPFEPFDAAIASPTDPSVRVLLDELDDELFTQAPNDEHFIELPSDDVTPGKGAMVMLRLDGDPVGCGAVRDLGGGDAELKRMYVRPQARGLRLGSVLIDLLEQHARDLGARRVLLETSADLPAAVTMYERAGYQRVERFGPYVNSHSSYCMGKTLT